MDVVSKARFAARRLKAASKCPNVVVARRARQLGDYLDRNRRVRESAVLAGPFPELSAIHCFMRDWGLAIDGVCRSATKYGRSER